MGRLKRIYTDADKAGVYTALTVNNGNVRRTSRDTGVPSSTIREWRTLWETEGVPPEILEPAEIIASEIVEHMERVRDKALVALERDIERGLVRPAQLVATVGVLEDKIRLGKGLATSRSESVQSLPPVEEMAEAIGEYFRDMLERQKEREQDIIEVAEDAEYREVPQLELTNAE